jgi:hypothetical protein
MEGALLPTHAGLRSRPGARRDSEPWVARQPEARPMDPRQVAQPARPPLGSALLDRTGP